MAEKPFTGLTAKVTIEDSGSPTTIGYISGCTLSLSKEIIEILAFGMTYKEKVPAVKDWTLSIDGTAAFAKDGSQKKLYDAFESGVGVTFGMYLDDTTYFKGTGYISSLDIEAAPDDKISISSEVSGSGAVTMTLPGA